jgi:ADP-ribose pyrophosphatase
MTFRPVGSRRLATGVFLGLDELTLETPDRQTVLRDIIRHPGGVAVLPVDGEDVWLVDQYRAAFDRRVLEVPAGKLDTDGESTQDAAARELEEELGFKPLRMVSLGQMMPSPGYTDEIIHLYAADGIVPGTARPHGAEELDARVVRLSLQQVIDMIDGGEIEDAKTQLAVLAWMRRSK